MLGWVSSTASPCTCAEPSRCRRCRSKALAGRRKVDHISRPGVPLKACTRKILGRHRPSRLPDQPGRDSWSSGNFATPSARTGLDRTGGLVPRRTPAALRRPCSTARRRPPSRDRGGRRHRRASLAPAPTVSRGGACRARRARRRPTSGRTLSALEWAAAAAHSASRWSAGRLGERAAARAVPRDEARAAPRRDGRSVWLSGWPVLAPAHAVGDAVGVLRGVRKKPMLQVGRRSFCRPAVSVHASSHAARNGRPRQRMCRRPASAPAYQLMWCCCRPACRPRPGTG